MRNWDLNQNSYTRENTQSNWDKLSFKERAALIRLGVLNNIYDINTIRDTYNKYADGGNTAVNRKDKYLIDKNINHKGLVTYRKVPLGKRSKNYIKRHIKDFYVNGFYVVDVLRSANGGKTLLLRRDGVRSQDIRDKLDYNGQSIQYVWDDPEHTTYSAYSRNPNYLEVEKKLPSPLIGMEVKNPNPSEILEKLKDIQFPRKKTLEEKGIENTIGNIQYRVVPEKYRQGLAKIDEAGKTYYDFGNYDLKDIRAALEEVLKEHSNFVDNNVYSIPQVENRSSISNPAVNNQTNGVSAQLQQNANNNTSTSKAPPKNKNLIDTIKDFVIDSKKPDTPVTTSPVNKMMAVQLYAYENSPKHIYKIAPELADLVKQKLQSANRPSNAPFSSYFYTTEPLINTINNQVNDSTFHDVFLLSNGSIKDISKSAPAQYATPAWHQNTDGTAPINYYYDDIDVSVPEAVGKHTIYSVFTSPILGKQNNVYVESKDSPRLVINPASPSNFKRAERYKQFITDTEGKAYSSLKDNTYYMEDINGRAHKMNQIPITTVISRDLLDDPYLTNAEIYNEYANGGNIHIKSENRGKFTELKERTGKSSTWYKENGTPEQKKMATFALNARKWNHKHDGTESDSLLHTVDSWLPSFAYSPTKRLLKNEVTESNPYFAPITKEGLERGLKIANLIDDKDYYKNITRGKEFKEDRAMGIIEQNPGLKPVMDLEDFIDFTPLGDIKLAGEAAGAALDGNIGEAALLGSMLVVPNAVAKTIVPGIKALTKKGVREVATKEAVEKADREFLKQINKQTRRYGYKPLDLNISKQGTEAVNKAVQERLLDMNTFARGVYTVRDDVILDPFGTVLPGGFNPQDILNAINLNNTLKELGIEPTAKNRLEYTLTHLAGNTGHGRTGVDRRIGTLYTSNDFGLPTSTAERYSLPTTKYGNFRDYYDNLVGILQRPVEFGSDRSRWFAQSEYPVFPSRDYTGVDVEDVFSDLEKAKSFLNKRQSETLRLASFVDNLNGRATPEYRELLRRYYNPYDEAGIFKDTYSKLLIGETMKRDAALSEIYYLANKHNIKIPKKKINIQNYEAIRTGLENIDSTAKALKIKKLANNSFGLDYLVYDLDVLKKDVYRNLNLGDTELKKFFKHEANAAVGAAGSKFAAYNDVRNYIFDHQLQDFINYGKDFRWFETPIILDSAMPTYNAVKGVDPQYAHFIFTGKQEGLQPVKLIDSYVPGDRNTIPTSHGHFGTNVQVNRHSRDTGGYLQNLTSKPFSYYPIPTVRYDDGGHLYGLGSWLKNLLGFNNIDNNDIAIRQAYAESGFNSDSVSPKGAAGIYQIKQNALDDYNKANNTTYSTSDLKNDTLSTLVRNWIMDSYMNRPWNTKNNPSDSVRVAKALAAYNYGSSNMINGLNKAKADGKDVYGSGDTIDWSFMDYWPKETRDYVNFVLRGLSNSLHRNEAAFAAKKKLKSKTVKTIKNTK